MLLGQSLFFLANTHKIWLYTHTMIYKRGKIWYIGYSANGRLMREAVGESRKFAELVLGKKRAEVREGRFLDVKKHGSPTKIPA